jgi:hypothetical protein
MEYEAERRRLDQQRRLKRDKGESSSSSSSFSSSAVMLQRSQRVVNGGVATNNRASNHWKEVLVDGGRTKGINLQNIALSSEVLPYGVHHIDPALLASAKSSADSSFVNFVLNNTNILRKMKGLKQGKDLGVTRNKSSDPAVVLAFTAKLDEQTKQIIDRQVFVQQLYECRIASLERYMAFCVMFHAMAVSSSRPWLCSPWNISRSQSCLRVATTGTVYADADVDVFESVHVCV